MISLSHWGMFEAEKPKWQPEDNRALGKYQGAQQSLYYQQQVQAGNAQNSLYQKNNFGRLD